MSGPEGGRVAVVGYAFRLPGAETPADLWSGIREARVAVVPAEEELSGVHERPEAAFEPGYLDLHGRMRGADEFDHELFGFSPREARETDPQQRKFLECAHEALEHAGYGRRPAGLRIGVVGGVGNNAYLTRNLLPAVGRSELESLTTLVASEKDHVATRVAHRLDLRGPAMTVQSSCSTSLVAVHLARQALLAGDADVMLAGACSIQVPLGAGYDPSHSGIASPSGSCRAFDASADGTVFGSGAVVVVLKRLADAVADGDTVHAVILGSAINNDGARKMSYTAPSIQGQVEVISAALSSAGVEPDSVGYVESHGTGTELGDAIEFAALSRVFGSRPAREDRCVIGTLKPNLGHLDSAAGLAGLVKAILVLQHRELPPNALLTTPHPDLGIEDSAFEFLRGPREWKRGAHPRRAGVSCFGVGGTNAHIVLEEAPDLVRQEAVDRPVLLPVSADDLTGWAASADALVEQLGRARASELPLGDVAFTLQEGRRHASFRGVAVGRTSAELASRLAGSTPRRVIPRARVAFQFSGFGASPGTEALALAADLPAFGERFDSITARLSDGLGFDLGAELGASSRRYDETDPRVGQPTQFAFQVALADLLGSWGLHPTVVWGHSLGEYAAAVVAGALEVDDAVSLVVGRARVMAQLPDGAMTAVFAGPAEVEPFLRPGVGVAALNGPGAVVVSGDLDPLTSIEDELAGRGVRHVRLPIPFAAHSAHMDPHLAAFAELAARGRAGTLRTAYLSCVDGQRRGPGESLDASYWVRHLREPVRFADAVGSLAGERLVVLEIGTGQGLTQLVRQVDLGGSVVAVPACFPDDTSGLDTLSAVLQGAGEAWASGAPLDFASLRSRPGRRVPLPTTPLRSVRHWIPAADGPPDFVASGDTEVTSPQDVVLSVPGGRGSTDPAQESSTRAWLEASWREILGCDPVRDEDDFFSLGGSSLALVTLVERLRKELGVTVALRDVAAAPTLAAMTRLVRARR